MIVQHLVCDGCGCNGPRPDPTEHGTVVARALRRGWFCSPRFDYCATCVRERQGQAAPLLTERAHLEHGRGAVCLALLALLVGAAVATAQDESLVEGPVTAVNLRCRAHFVSATPYEVLLGVVSFPAGDLEQLIDCGVMHQGGKDCVMPWPRSSVVGGTEAYRCRAYVENGPDDAVVLLDPAFPTPAPTRTRTPSPTPTRTRTPTPTPTLTPSETPTPLAAPTCCHANPAGGCSDWSAYPCPPQVTATCCLRASPTGCSFQVSGTSCPTPDATPSPAATPMAMAV